MAKKTDEIEVAVAEVVDYLRITGGFAPALAEVVQRKVTAAAAKKSGLRVTAKQLQKAADAFRASLGLDKAKATRAWMRNNGVTIETLEDYLETNLLTAKFRDELEKKSPKRKHLDAPVVQELVRDLIYEEWLAKALA